MPGINTDTYLAQSSNIREKVKSLLLDYVSDQSASADPTVIAITTAIAQQPERAAQLVTEKIVIVDGGIDLDSDRAALEAVILTAGTKAFMMKMFGITATP